MNGQARTFSEKEWARLCAQCGIATPETATPADVRRYVRSLQHAALATPRELVDVAARFQRRLRGLVRVGDRASGAEKDKR